MAADVDICNLALGFLGDSGTVASIDPPEGSAQASHCARFYPIALNASLAGYDWSFLTSRASLAQLTNLSTTWAYAYAAPADSLKIISILSNDACSDQQSGDYAVERAADGSKIILTNQVNAVCRYTTQTIDSAKFSSLFTLGLARHLASMLAGPLLKGEQGRQESLAQLKLATAIIAQAKVDDANQQQIEINHIPDWMRR